MTLSQSVRKLAAILTSLLILATGTLSLASTAAMAAGSALEATPASATPPPMEMAQPCHDQDFTGRPDAIAPDTVAKVQVPGKVLHKGCPMGGEHCHCVTGASAAAILPVFVTASALPAASPTPATAEPATLAGIHHDLLRPPSA